MKIEIIYRDEKVVVANKPRGLGTTPATGGRVELLERLAEQIQQPRAKLTLINQIDDEASGVAVVGLDEPTARQLAGQLSDNDITITYLALVHGLAAEAEQTVTTLLTRSRANALLMKVTRKKGVKAVTEVRVLADFGSAALVAASPLTHRRHQVRVHLSHISLPVVADGAYGNSMGLYLSQFKADYRSPGKDREEKALLDEPAIHLYQVQARAGLLAGRTFVAPLDSKFIAALKMLAKHNRRRMGAFADPDQLDSLLGGRAL